MLRHLSIDIETKSSVDIGKAGLYRYAQSEDFEVLLFAYQMDDGEVELVDLAQGEQIPENVQLMLKDVAVVKHAYNAAFEWYCLNRAGYETPLEQWRCTMIHGLYCGYTAGLDATGKAIGLPQDKQKLTTGKALIRYFCVPCKPTKSNGNRTWNLRGNRACNIKTSELFSGSGRRTGVMAAGYPDERLWCARGFETD